MKLLDRVLFAAAEKSAATGQPVNTLAGLLVLSQTGDLILTVPSALLRGLFTALSEPGVEYLADVPGSPKVPAIVVATAAELSRAGIDPDSVSERGKAFTYGTGRVFTYSSRKVVDGAARVWAVRVHSPALQKLRKSYGLSAKPAGGTADFHVAFAVRRAGVLAPGDEVTKVV